MRNRTATLVTAAIAMALVLVGCAPSGPSESAGDDTAASASPSSTPTADPKPAELVLSLDSFALVDDHGTTMSSATWEDPTAGLALLGTAFGSTPTPVYTETYDTNLYDWGAVKFTVVGDGYSYMFVSAATLAGLAIHTDQDIAVGSTRAQVAALSHYDVGYDEDGDGLSDNFGLEPRVHPGSTALTPEGGTGLDFISARFTGDVVTVILSPSNNWGDV
jgi:hypothetical protein